MATTIEIVRGIQQARANAYDGSHDERYSYDGEERKIGLRREEGSPLLDSRVMDGFDFKISGTELTVCYHTEFTAKEAHQSGIESDIGQTIADIVKYLKREYKKIVGETLSLKKPSDVDISMQMISRHRVSVKAYQTYNIGGMDDSTEPVGEESEAKLDKAIKSFLDQGREKAKKPSNYTAKNES